MTVRQLRDVHAAALRARGLTYPEVGASIGPHPAGYRSVHMERFVAGGDLAAMTETLMTWRVHAGAGLGVQASSPRVEVGAVVQLTWNPVQRWARHPRAAWGIAIPCQVISVIDSPTRTGFTYGTLGGHPESGEELFELRAVDGGVVFTCTAFSRPGTWWARLGAPVAERIQDATTRRYLDAITST